MQVEEILEFYSREYNIPGMIVAEGNNEQVAVYTYGYGDMQKKTKISEDSLFEIASLSKAFTALLILLYAEKEMLSLDSCISEYLNGLHICLKSTGEDLTATLRIRDLVYHTSGYTSNSILECSSKENVDYLKIIKQINREYILFRPGEKYEYSSMNYVLLQLIIEKISNRSYANEMERMVFKPLGLEHTSADYEKVLKTGKLVCSYKLAFLKHRSVKSIDHTYEAAAGYIFSDMRDMIRWSRIQLGIVQDIPEEYKIIVKKSHEMGLDKWINEVSFYAAGWVIYTREKKMIHSGNNPSFSSIIEIRSEKNSFIVLMQNINTTQMEKMIKSIRNKKISGKGKKTNFLNWKLDVLNSILIISEILCILSIIMQKDFSVLMLNVFIMIIFGVLVLQYLFCSIIKKFRIKLILEWGPGSIVWSYFFFGIIVILSILKRV